MDDDQSVGGVRRRSEPGTDISAEPDLVVSRPGLFAGHDRVDPDGVYRNVGETKNILQVHAKAVDVEVGHDAEEAVVLRRKLEVCRRAYGLRDGRVTQLGGEHVGAVQPVLSQPLWFEMAERDGTRLVGEQHRVVPG